MKMNLILALAGLAIGFAVSTLAQEKDAVDPQTRQQLEAIDKIFDEAYNKNDAAAIAALFTKDAVLISPLGVFSGRAGVEKYFVDVFHRWIITDYVSRLDHAYASGSDICAIGGYTDNIDSTPSIGYRSLVYTREGDTWKIRVMVRLFSLGSASAPVLAPTPTPGQTTTPALTLEATPLPTPTMGDNFTEVLPDRHVTFRLLAPKANAVSILVGVKSGVDEPQGTTNSEMMKDSKGLWTVTLGPFEPNLYEYRFSLDGRKITDPGNDMPKPQRHVDTSLLLIPGDPSDFLNVQNDAHGTMSDETYFSTTLGENRRLLVYTPPGYDRSHAPLPVLYLYHGFWDTRYSWVTEGRLAQILDSLLAQGKTVPMIVVVPEAHALPPEPTQNTSRDAGLYYMNRNQREVDEELFHDIIPFIKAHYKISDKAQERAIAGLSMGGLQAIETGIGHLGYFCWIGAFSPAVQPKALSDEFKNALKDPYKINQNLWLFDIVVGDNDKIIDYDVINAWEAQLKQANVQHVYTVVPGGTHSMFVWRPALCNFLQEIFKR